MKSETENLPLIFQERVKEFGNRPALLSHDDEDIQAISWFEFGRLVREFALGLSSMGVGTGERMAILSENRPEWIISDLAIQAIGSISVPIYSTLTPKEIEFILLDSGASTIIISDAHQYKKIAGIKDGVPSLKRIIGFDVEGEEVVSMKSVMAVGMDEKDDAFLNLRIHGIKADNIATIIYTSGTTGRPKGVMLSHKNLISNIRASLNQIIVKSDDLYLSFLPMSHIFERMIHHLMIHQGATIAYSKGFASVGADVAFFKPTVMAGVPFLFQRIKEKIIESVKKGGFVKSKLFSWAYGKGKERLATDSNHLFSRAAERLVLKKIRDRINPRLRYFISGGAPLPKEVGEFFWALGIPLLEGYGLTETSPVVSVNSLNAVKLGTVGKPISGVEVKIGSDGEIQVKGPNVMKGYWNMPEATKEVIKDGWFSTGDTGSIDKDGFLIITDRKKDIIITALGKNVAPQRLETLLRQSRYIKDAVIFGDKKPHLVALIVPELERLKEYSNGMEISYDNDKELINDKRIYRFYEDIVHKMLKDLARFEQIRRFALISELTQDTGELTPTLKIKRRVVEEKYKSVIDELYAAL
ncbi:MAG: long-chain fatty acid--CoA ligase [Deltaproteobacteria bacterium]|nr:long-chain fatty acid--CoA ligase [Deltaproteobacteria bacterium]